MYSSLIHGYCVHTFLYNTAKQIFPCSLLFHVQNLEQEPSRIFNVVKFGYALQLSVLFPNGKDVFVIRPFCERLESNLMIH
jgi:hypothetical protein